jgi:hypothetical protein
MNIIVDASPTLKRFLEARSKGAPAAELEELRAADEAAREAIRGRHRAAEKRRPGENVIFLPARTSASRR